MLHVQLLTVDASSVVLGNGLRGVERPPGDDHGGSGGAGQQGHLVGAHAVLHAAEAALLTDADLVPV